MGLIVLVMPLGKYFEDSSDNRIPKVLRADTADNTPRVPKQMAHARVRNLQMELSQACRKNIIWKDEGERVVSADFDYFAVHAIRAFAAYQDHPLPEPGRRLAEGFTLKPHPQQFPPWPQLPGGKANWTDPHFHPSLLKVYEGGKTRFPHLIEHLDFAGFYIPCELELPVKFVEHFDIEEQPAVKEEDDEELAEAMAFFIAARTGGNEESIWNVLKKPGAIAGLKQRAAEIDRTDASNCDWHKVGSSPALLRELEQLGRLLKMTRDWSELKAGETASLEGDPLAEVKYGWSVLHYCARMSVESQLPIVFDG